MTADITAISFSNQLDNMMARAEAQKKGSYDTIFIKDGLLTEASHSNVCIVKAGVIWTPATNEQMIRGITRSLVLQGLLLLQA